MRRSATASRTLLALFTLSCIALSSPHARADEGKVATIIVRIGPEQPASAKPLAEAIGRQLADEHRAPVAPIVRAAAPALTKNDLVEVRAIGQEALRDLADASKSKANLLGKYEPRIAKALTTVSAVQAGDARAVLWNICVLRVQLLLRQGASERLVKETVRDCRRRFVDQSDFSQVWQPEVVRAFRVHSEGIERLPLGVQSAPADCDVLIYGATVGKTPMRLDVQSGPVELQLKCGPRASRVHVLHIERPQDIAIRLEADDAIRGEHGTALWLGYSSEADARNAMDHAYALAGEAGAETFVLVTRAGGDWTLDWVLTEGGTINTVRVREQAPATEMRSAAVRLFRERKPAQASATPTPRARPSVRRTWKDYALGGALVLGGIGTSIYPAMALASGDECVDDACTRVRTTGDAGSWALLGVSAALVASGVAVTWVAPFGRRSPGRADVAIGLGSIAVKGTF